MLNFFKILVLSLAEKTLPPPCNHLYIGALRLPTLARHQPITYLIPSCKVGNRIAPMSRWLRGGRFFSVYSSTTRTSSIIVENSGRDVKGASRKYSWLDAKKVNL